MLTLLCCLTRFTSLTLTIVVPSVPKGLSSLTLGRRAFLRSLTVLFLSSLVAILSGLSGIAIVKLIIEMFGSASGLGIVVELVDVELFICVLLALTVIFPLIVTLFDCVGVFAWPVALVVLPEALVIWLVALVVLVVLT